jgi:hypothetical protein
MSRTAPWPTVFREGIVKCVQRYRDSSLENFRKREKTRIRPGSAIVVGIYACLKVVPFSSGYTVSILPETCRIVEWHLEASNGKGTSCE